MLGPILLEVVGFVLVLWLVMRRKSETAVPIPILALFVALLVAFGVMFGMTFMSTGSPPWLIVPIRIAIGVSGITMLAMIILNWPSRAPRAANRQGGSSRLEAVAAKRSSQLPTPFL